MNQDSRCIPLPWNDSYSVDSTDHSCVANPQEENASTSIPICAEEKKGNARNVYHIVFPDYKMPTLDSESSGQETIFNMVRNRFEQFKSTDTSNRNPKYENMLFRNWSNDCIINVGLPVGVLSTKETYICGFKKGTFLPGIYSRQYAVDQYTSKWEMGQFFVSFKDKIPAGVSPFIKILQGKQMRVDFFKDETLFEALVRDNRFDEEKLRHCMIFCSGKQLHLSYKAGNYQGKSINIDSLNKKKDVTLPDYIPPRPCPDVCTTNDKVEPRGVKQENQEVDSATVGPSNEVPLDSSTPVQTRQSVKLQASKKDLVHLIKCKFENNSHQLSANDKKKLAKEFELQFSHFSSRQGFCPYVCELEEITAIAKSVGAICILDSGMCPMLMGTCFRIGTEYIITNNHVIQDIEKEDAMSTMFVDFNFIKGEVPKANGERYVHDSLLVRSEELDYAILRMKKPVELTPCIFSHGVSIMDPNDSHWSLLDGHSLTFIGHPYNQAKKTDIVCPVDVSPQYGLNCYVTSLRQGGDAEKDYRQLKDQRRGMYHVHKFFNGSSGSPGILFLNDTKLLVVLHTRGFWLSNDKNSSVEQGIKITEIIKDVEQRINKEQQQHPDQNLLKLADLFPITDVATFHQTPCVPMDTA